MGRRLAQDGLRTAPWAKTAVSARRSAAKPRIPRGAIGSIPRARGDAVTIAVRMVAQVRASTRDSAFPGRRAGRVLPRSVEVEIDAPVVGTPFPHISRGVVETKPVRLEGRNRAGAGVAIIH